MMTFPLADVELNLDIKQTRQNQFPRLLSYCTRKMNDYSILQNRKISEPF